MKGVLYLSQVTKTLEKIEKMYRNYKYEEKLLDVYKDASKHHFEKADLDENKMIVLGMLLHYRSNPTYKWHKKELNELLEDTGGTYLLAQAKKVDKHVAKFIELVVTENGESVLKPLSSLAFEPDFYVRPYGGRRPKKVTDDEKAKLNALLSELKEKDVEDVVNEFKIKKLNYTMLDNQYNALREELLHAMEEEGMDEIASEVGKFKVIEKDPEYDITHFLGKSFYKTLHYSIRPIDGTKIEVIDHFSKETVVSETDTFIVDYHELSFTDSGIFVDGTQISLLTKDEFFALETTLNESEEYSHLPLEGAIMIDDTTLLRQLPFSTGKIDLLIDDGYLHPKTLKEYRYIADYDKLRFDFEIIEQSSHNARMEVFMSKNAKRGQTLRYMQEAAYEVLKEM